MLMKNKLKKIKLHIFPHIIYVGYGTTKESFRTYVTEITKNNKFAIEYLPDHLIAVASLLIM
jgi:hypothetical protein